MEIWGGIECTINRVGADYHDQLIYQGHYERLDDIDRIADLGIEKLRYPILWEKHKSDGDSADWSAIDPHLIQLKNKGISVIAGLVHHGSGPDYVSILEDSFASGLAEYAGEVAAKYPWIDDFTPINEPLTTARFTGLYGLWYPHYTQEEAFLRILVNECKATVLAMHAIREVNPKARLIHTEDLGKTHSTPGLQYQAEFENKRRWLGIDLLCGKVDESHFFWSYMIDRGIQEAELRFFILNVTIPDVMGFNYYVTSERYLDEEIDNYPHYTHGGNGQQQYADVEAVRSGDVVSTGLKVLLREAWTRYRIPLAITEAHLHCGREDQLRWLKQIVEIADELINEGIPVNGVTVWSMFGAYGWNHLLTRQDGSYESGVFDLRSTLPRATALAKMVKSLIRNSKTFHPVSYGEGWWSRSGRIIYGNKESIGSDVQPQQTCKPLLVIGAETALGKTIISVCQHRNIRYVALSSDDIYPGCETQIEKLFDRYKPWAIIETDQEHCVSHKSIGSGRLAAFCQLKGVQLLKFSSDQVFDGRKQSAYTESDSVNPLNWYGHTKAQEEEEILKSNPGALIIRSGSLFGFPESNGIIQNIVGALSRQQPLTIPDDVFVSPTHIWDLVNSSLDLLIDDEHAIWHLANDGRIKCCDLAREIADRTGYSPRILTTQPLLTITEAPGGPVFNSLTSDKGIFLPTLDHALNRVFSKQIPNFSAF